MGMLRNTMTTLLGDKQANKEKGYIREGVAGAINEMDAGFAPAMRYMQPYYEAGVQNLNALQDPTANFYASPDYEFRRSEGMRDIGNQFSVRGSGGNALKALAQYNSALASGEFNNWFGRTANIAGMGMDAGQFQSGLTANNAMARANLRMGEGNALAGITRNKYTNINNSMQTGFNNANEMLANYFGSMGFSDARLKRNIRRVGTKAGYPWYEWTFIWGEKGEGVMSHEVPAKYVTTVNGFDAVDYDALLGGA